MKKNLSTIIAIIILLNIVIVNAQPETNSIELNSPSAILIESSTGRILYEKNANAVMYPASITKIMTALLALEEGNPTDIISASPNAISSISYDSSNIGMLISEEMSLENLLYALLVASANESANVIAEHISGSIDDFVKLMNDRAKELGAKNTHFTNTNGLPDDNHYTTAYDMALIAKEAMKNEMFRKIVATDYYEIPPTNKYTDTRYLSNTNYLINKAHMTQNVNYLYEHAIGIKTGWTTKANHTLVAAAKKDNLEVITVVLGAEKKGNKTYSYEDTIRLFEYGFNNYSFQNIISPGEIIKEVNVVEAKDNESIMLITLGHLEALMPNDYDKEKIEKNITVNDNITAPINKGQVLGTVTLKYEDYELGKVSLVSDRNLEREPVEVIKENAFSFIEEPWVKILIYILGAILILIIILLIMRLIRRKRRRYIYSSRRNVSYLKNRRRRRR